MQDINQAGGVMGKKMKVVSSDDAADSVDALPALRLLLLPNPVAVIGPFSPTIQAVIHDLAANNVADFALGGTALTSMARGGSGAPSTTPDAGLWTGSAQSPDRSWQRPLPESA
jgi:ABC-type branched-subunit amino acid transport system substrate-binding protein